MVATTAATNNAIEELKTMFTIYLGKLKDLEEANPSISKSALENQLFDVVLEVEPSESKPISSPKTVIVHDVRKKPTSPHIASGP